MRQRFRSILFPFSLTYGFIVWLRNKLFDKKILRSAGFDFPVICVGNLAVGGTGKTPMAEYLVTLLHTKYNVATLSRGYKRKTKGFFIAGENTTAAEIGDEPMQLHTKFPELTVAVAEERIIGVPQLLHDRPGTEVIILDDAFQHREVNAGLNILLTDCNNLYTKDTMLPSGNLRDVKTSSKRANIIIVTKCKADLTTREREETLKELRPGQAQKVFFTTIGYESPYHLFTKQTKNLDRDSNVLLVCGIANPEALKEFITTKTGECESLIFGDHHAFTAKDISEIKNKFSEIPGPDKMIVTTEKDSARLSKFENELKHLPVYAIPMRHQFLFGDAAQFETCIMSFIESFGDSELNPRTTP